ncbi:MAG: DUF4097 family beta strand repeat-containing protein [Oscillospiraceae bacterium]
MKKWLKITLTAALVLLVLGGAAWTGAYCLGARPAEVFNDNTLHLPDGVHMSFGSGGSSGIFISDRHGFGSEDLNSAVSPDGTYTLSAEGIDSLSIDWLSGSAKVLVTEGSRITIAESAPGGIRESEALRYAVKDGTLSILYTASGSGLVFDLPSKELVLSIPASLAGSLRDFTFSSTSASLELSGLTLSGRLKFGSTSGALTASGVQAGIVSLSTTSGGLRFTEGGADVLTFSTTSGAARITGSRIGELEVDSTSGKLEADGEFERIDVDTISGAVTLACGVCPRELDVDSTSGGVTLTLPKGSGFTVDFDSTSGSFRCDFPATTRGDTHTVGSGSAQFDVETISGSLTIKEG